MIRGGNPPPKIHPQNKKSCSLEHVFLNNFRWLSDSCHRKKKGKRSRELFEKKKKKECKNCVFLGYFGILSGLFGSLNISAFIPPIENRTFLETDFIIDFVGDFGTCSSLTRSSPMFPKRVCIRQNFRITEMSLRDLVGACFATGDRTSATGSDIVSKCVLRSCASFCLTPGHTIVV